MSIYTFLTKCLPGSCFTIPLSSKEELEKSLIREALEKCKGNKSEAAKLLGLTRKGLRMKISRYGLE